jgi:SAM-dependent methyltransferase
MSEQVLRHDKHCRLCGSSRIVTILHLNDTPLEDQFVSQEKKSVVQPSYPLELAICEYCGYVFLPHIVNPEASYADYVYVSALTVGLRNHYDQYAKEIADNFGTVEGSLVIDLGSNDGSMLASFKQLGMKVVGVEPANSIATQANESGLTTINGFFTDEVTQQILDEHGSASVVTANYMYANVDDVIGFTKNVAKLLAPDGIFVVQTGYHPEQMKIKMFDYIYHEHFSYFTVEVLKKLFSACGMELIDAQKTAPKGGSIRVIGQLKNGKRIIDSSVERIITEEQHAGMRKIEIYQKFALELAELKRQLLDRLNQLKRAGKKIAGFGASHSTTTLLYHFEAAPFIEYLVDDNEIKQGLYSPGYHLPVYSSQKLYDDAPDYVVILAWQHQDSITTKHQKYLAGGGHWIIPLPQLNLL